MGLTNWTSVSRMRGVPPARYGQLIGLAHKLSSPSWDVGLPDPEGLRLARVRAQE